MDFILLGIDIGTSACKVAAFSADGRALATSSVEYRVVYPRAGWAEQNPAEWWQAVCRGIRQLCEQEGLSPAHIAGIGVAGQSWSAIVVDRQADVLCDTPIWMDTRTAEICAQITGQIGADRLFAVSGNPLQPGYTLPKVLWYRQYRPDVYARTAKVLQSNSYITYRLTGNIVQDLSQGYGWACFSMQRGQWDRELCSEIGINPDVLPDLVPCHQIIGKVTRLAARETGLLQGTPVVAGGLDAACAALGVGVIEPGQVQEQSGQAGGMSVCIDQYQADPRLILSYHVVPGRWLLQGGTVGGGGVAGWLERELAAAEREQARQNGSETLAEIDRAAAQIPAGSEGVVFLPYMAGERSPIWDPLAKGVFYGLDFGKTRAHLYRAGLEGVAYSLRHNLEVAAAAGAPADRLVAAGGAASSRLWTQIKADVTGRPIQVPDQPNASALGAAILAGVATGVYRDFPDAVARTVRIRREHQPDAGQAEIYSQGYATYRALYRQLKPIMDGRE
jgi:xylulokinase